MQRNLRIPTVYTLHTMSHHPNEPLVEIVGIEEGGRGRSCEEHGVCGEALRIDSVVRFRTIQIINGEFCMW